MLSRVQCAADRVEIMSTPRFHSKASALSREVLEYQSDVLEQYRRQHAVDIDLATASLDRIKQHRSMISQMRRSGLWHGFEPTTIHLEFWIAERPEALDARVWRGRGDELDSIPILESSAPMLVEWSPNPDGEESVSRWAVVRILGRNSLAIAYQEFCSRAVELFAEADEPRLGRLISRLAPTDIEASQTDTLFITALILCFEWGQFGVPSDGAGLAAKLDAPSFSRPVPFPVGSLDLGVIEGLLQVHGRPASEAIELGLKPGLETAGFMFLRRVNEPWCIRARHPLNGFVLLAQLVARLTDDSGSGSDLITQRQAASEFGVSERTIQRRIKDQTLREYGNGRVSRDEMLEKRSLIRQRTPRVKRSSRARG